MLYYLYLLPGVLLAITLHEFAHGWVSWRLGDPTPQQDGRLTINPLKHLDPIGALCMLVFHMGWAKPVRINPGYYKNRKVGVALVSVAGPLMNVLTGSLAIVISCWMYVSCNYGSMQVTTAVNVIYQMLTYFSMLSINLAVFNLIPLPPLDGSKILSIFLPESVLDWFSRYDRYCMIILLVALYFGVLDTPISTAYNFVYNGVWKAAFYLFYSPAGGLV